jgi:hypothetical protein
MRQAIRMIDILGHRKASGAETTLIPGMVGIALNFYELSVFNMR